MKLVPVSVMVLLRYALLGEMVLLKVGAPVTVNALVPVVTTTVVGLLIVTSIPALPVTVDAPITTTTCVAEEILQDATLAPEEGTLPIFAVHDCDVTKLVPVTVMVLPK